MKRVVKGCIVCLLVLFISSLLGASSNLRKIVIFQQGVSDDAKDRIVLNAGCSIVKPLRLVNGMAVLLPETASDEAVEAILKNIGVVRIDTDLVIKAIRVTVGQGRRGRVTVTKPAAKPPDKGKPPKEEEPPETPPVQTLPWGIDRIDADAAQLSGYSGLGVKVAVVDTGIDLDHPDLAVNIKGNVNIINARKSGDDDNGHGTHVAGIIAAVDNDIGVVGVAPQSYLYAVKVLDRRGSGWLSDVIDGLNWCIANGIQVINMSLGSSSGNQSFQEAITNVYNAGITLVAAAGNNAGSVSYPAAYLETIAVSAIDINDGFAVFSNYGEKIDLTAPGVDISSTYKGGGYKSLSGTSMSCPHVVGVIAIELQQNLFSPDGVKAELTRSAEVLLGLSSDQQGAGLVDAEQILR